MVAAIEAGDLLDVLEHPNPDRYPGQRVLVVQIGEYVVWFLLSSTGREPSSSRR
ncbi:MAG: hypothetical protein ACH34U_13680 [Cyanobium sp.]